MISWKKNLAVIWLAQFLTIMGFAFAMPFIPYYLQEMGVTDKQELGRWIALFSAATPMSLAVFAPIWGSLSDRYGRRIMLLRANLAGAIILTLMGLAETPQMLVLLRVLQGVFTGTLTAAQTLVASETPRQHSGMALGTLSTAVFSGVALGAGLGGVVAHYFGYRSAFFVSGVLMLVGFLLILLGTREKFIPPTRGAPGAFMNKRTLLPLVLPVLIVVATLSFVRQFEMPFYPLLVQEIYGSLEGVSLWTGLLAALGGLAGLLSGVWLGRWADRMEPARLGVQACLGASLASLPHIWVRQLAWLFPLRVGMMFCGGGLDSVFQVWISKHTPADRRGLLFGWTGTARSMGWMLSPLAGGWLVSQYGIRSIYLAVSIMYALIMVLIYKMLRRNPDPVPGAAAEHP